MCVGDGGVCVCVEGGDVCVWRGGGWCVCVHACLRAWVCVGVSEYNNNA